MAKISFSTLGLCLDVLALLMIFLATVYGRANEAILGIMALAVITYFIALYHIKFERAQASSY